MTRILWFGDLSPSGFGTVTTDLGRALLDAGADVRFASQNDVGIIPEPFASRCLDLAYLEVQLSKVVAGQVEQGVTDIRNVVADLVTGAGPDVYLVSGEAWGDWKPDACVLLGDFAAARLMWLRFREAFSGVPTWHYCPIEGIDLPPLWGELWAQLRPVAMSRFGQQEMRKVIGYEPPLAYHGVDTTAFRPVSPSAPLTVPRNDDGDEMVTLASREACRRFFGGDPAHTWLLRTDRHMPRKGMNGLLRSMTPVLARHPEARLVLHCPAFDQGGFLPDSISKMPRAVQAQVILTDRRGLPREVLVALYNAADIYVSTSAEGFGLTIAEALACGVPVVGLDYSAVPEVIGPAGVTVPAAGLYDNEYDHYWAAVDEAAYADAVEYLMEHPAKRRALGALGPGHVASHFRWDRAAAVFLDSIERALDASAEVAA